MGTSASYRSPLTTKWNAVRVAIGTPSIPVNRSVSEVWNAAGESDLLTDSVAEVYTTWLEVAGELSHRAQETAPSTVLQEVVREARHRALAIGASVAASAAERALQQAAREAAVGTLSFIAAQPSQIREGWLSLRESSPEARTQLFLGHLIDQLTRFYVARDLPEYIGTKALPHASAFRARVDELGEAARAVVSETEVGRIDTGNPADAWRETLKKALAQLTEMGSVVE